MLASNGSNNPAGQAIGESEQFEEVCRAMADPAFYPHPVILLERRETHISVVFLTGTYVYKLKKPVDFGFLDYRRIESRLHFCKREVSLNRRLSIGVYAGVVSICRDSTGRLYLSEGEKAVEYAVKMMQLPEDESLRALLRSGNVVSSQMETLGRHLADFYSSSSRNPEIDHLGHPDVVAYNMEENFRQLEAFVGGLGLAEEWEFIREVSRSFFQYWRELFERRVLTGRIRDGHGDLRTEHIYFHDGIQIIDCIEFNDRFRYGDVVADLAFLHMDMEHLGHSDLSLAGLAAYAEQAGDHTIYTLLDFYAAYRALVKAKVACLRSTEVHSAHERSLLEDEARDYLRLAYRYAIQFSRPTLWVFMGLPASGKSSLAEAIARTLSLHLFQSDSVRKEWVGHLLGLPEVAPYDQGLHRTEIRHRVYGKMLALAQEKLKNGHSVALDATFSHRKWRDQVRRLAVDLDTGLIFVECACSEATLVERLKGREEVPGLSDARLQHLPDMIRESEETTELSPEILLRVDTGQPFAKSFSDVLSGGYARKFAQVLKLLG